jgi:subtilisin family serine protease
MRVAIIDSGVHASHPHVGGVAGGIAITDEGDHSDYVDRLGHGTAVAAAIREKAPQAELFAVKIFDRTLSASVPVLVRAIDWAVANGMHVVNLSLGTAVLHHESVLRAAVDRAASAGVSIAAARDHDGVRWLPGSMRSPAIVPVQLDWDCPRGEWRVAEADGHTVYRASGFPRPIPGVSPRRNLSGISFAVANVTGLLAGHSLRLRT